ncbi:MAG: hypothetical protein IPP78_15260 [Holophagaceae bacterium]|nr:hypothetical protein [Holophagaceae bacterium]
MALANAWMNPWFKRLIRLGLLITVLIGWKAIWIYGPRLVGSATGKTNAAPAIFKVHAKILLKSTLGYPRQVEASIPAPETGSNASAQLQLMKFWDGKNWGPEALRTGHVEGHSLKIPAGQLVFMEVLDVTPARDYNGPVMCQVDYRVRWDFDETARDLFAKRQLINLRPPKGLGSSTPGQELSKQVTLERVAWWGPQWILQDAAQWQAAEPGKPSEGLAWLPWLF